MLVSVVVTFMSKNRSSLLVSPKMLKKKKRHSIAVCGRLCGEQLFLLISIPF